MTTATANVVPDRPSAELLDVRAVAGMLGCSSRTVYRLSDGGKLPRPLKLGALVRWRRAEVLEWIRGGCRAVRTMRGTGR